MKLRVVVEDEDGNRVNRKLLSVHEAEALTGRKAATWRRDISKRRIAFVKLGPRQVKIPIEVIEKLINDGYRPARSQNE